MLKGLIKMWAHERFTGYKKENVQNGLINYYYYQELKTISR